MPKFEIMDQTGHTTWPEEGLQDKDREEIWRRDADKMFDKLVAEHRSAFKRMPGQSSSDPMVHTKVFDPTAEETMFIPRLQGG